MSQACRMMFDVQKKIIVFTITTCIQHIQGACSVIQWLRFYPLNPGGQGLIPGWGTRSQVPQLRVPVLQLKKNLYVAMKIKDLEVSLPRAGAAK